MAAAAYARLVPADQQEMPGERLIEEITAVYRNVGVELAATLRIALRDPNPTRARRTAQERSARILASAWERVRSLLVGAAREAAGVGDERAVAQARRVVLRDAAARLTGYQRTAQAILRENLSARLDQLAEGMVRLHADPYLPAQRDLVGRRIDDALRRIQLTRAAEGLAEGQTRRTISGAILDDLNALPDGTTAAVQDLARPDPLTQQLSEGRYFVNSRGAAYSPEDYARMVARTVTREAVSQAQLYRWQRVGIDLVLVSQHRGGDCPICAPYHGKTFSLSGATQGYPTLDQAPPYHPNCRHILTVSPQAEIVGPSAGVGLVQALTPLPPA